MTMAVTLQQYQEGTITWAHFVEEAVSFMDSILRQNPRLAPDQRWDIISILYLRMEKLIQTYQERGASFDAYLGTCVRHASRSYIRTQTRHTQRFLFLDPEMEPTDDCLLVEEHPEPVYGVYHPEVQHLIRGKTADRLRRQLMYAFCRNIPVLSPEDCRRYSQILDLPRRWVDAVIAYSLHHRQDRSQRRTHLRERRNHHYNRMSVWSLRMCNAESDEDREYCEKRYRNHRRLWLSQVEQLSRQTYHLTSREVATLLGVPKGSVDSSLHHLNRALENLPPGAVPSGA